jgi:hypothetical protein
MPAPPSPKAVAEPHLAWAQQEADRVVDEHVKAIDAFFDAARKNTRPFADEALSWGSKWRIVADKTPFTKGGKHEKFMRAKFEEYVFTSEQLEEAVKQVVASYIRHIESIESQMLVRIRADVSDLPSSYRITQIDADKLHASYEEALAQVLKASDGSLRSDVATEIVSIIAGEVLAQVAVRMGVSAGILGSGAASSWATFGIGAVVGLIVDQIVSRVWDWYADPRGNLAKDLDQKLKDIRRWIVEGSGDSPGLRDRLRQFANERSPVRRQAVLSLLEPQLGGANP